MVSLYWVSVARTRRKQADGKALRDREREILQQEQQIDLGVEGGWTYFGSGPVTCGFFWGWRMIQLHKQKRW